MSRMASRADLLLAPLPARSVASAVQEGALASMPPAVVTLADASGAAPQSPVVDGNRDAPVPARAGVSSATQDTATTHASGVTSSASPVLAAPASPQTRAKTSAFAAKQATTAQVGAPSPLPHSPANAGSIGGSLLSLLLVIGLILGLAWLAKRMPGFRGAAGNSALRVVGSLALGPRERVVVVAVGNTQLVLGVGAGGTRTLHTLTEPLPVADAKTSPAFAQLLAQHFGKKA